MAAEEDAVWAGGEAGAVGNKEIGLRTDAGTEDGGLLVKAHERRRTKEQQRRSRDESGIKDWRRVLRYRVRYLLLQTGLCLGECRIGQGKGFWHNSQIERLLQDHRGGQQSSYGPDSARRGREANHPTRLRLG